MNMKRLLLIAASVGLAMLASPVAADELPRSYLGAWCASGVTDIGETFVRTKNLKACEQWMTIRARGFVDADGERTCRFLRVYKIHPSTVLAGHFLVRARCQAVDAEPYGQEIMFTLTGTVLTVQEDAP
jgi:hypothetical protein